MGPLSPHLVHLVTSAKAAMKLDWEWPEINQQGRCIKAQQVSLKTDLLLVTVAWSTNSAMCVQPKAPKSILGLRKTGKCLQRFLVCERRMQCSVCEYETLK